jgi:tRNA pseudouridine13 synthase
MSTESPDELPYATAKSLRVFGKIRQQPHDFQVDEIPAYEPSGSGDHLFVRFEKTGLNTPAAVTQLARALDSDPSQAGWAGLKDRHAVTTQWASFFRADAARARALELPGIRVLDAHPHPHKIRTGHLRGNRFRIRVVSGDDPLPIAEQVLAELASHGAPNYYGEQRFGIDDGNLERALRWLREGGPAPRDRFQRKLLVSTWQSSLFNRWLAARVARGELGRAREGDVMRKEDSGGIFVSDDLAADQLRMDGWEISPTGPMFGSKMRWPTGEAERVERALWAEHGLDEAVVSRLGALAEGTRRVARIRPAETQVSADAEGVVLAFVLPKGAYATVILRELLKN